MEKGEKNLSYTYKKGNPHFNHSPLGIPDCNIIPFNVLGFIDLLA